LTVTLSHGYIAAEVDNCLRFLLSGWRKPLELLVHLHDFLLLV